jgi:hypothetical protein
LPATLLKPVCWQSKEDVAMTIASLGGCPRDDCDGS